MDKSLREVAGTCTALYESITDQSVAERLRACGPWIKALLGQMLGLSAGTTLPTGLRFVVIDASTVQAPGAKGTDHRLHIAMDLVSLELIEVLVSDVHTGETFTHFTLGPGDVAVTDRGYAQAQGMHEAVQRGAALLVPRPELLYAQVVKTVRRRRLVQLTHRAVFGTQTAIEQVLASYGWQINTAFIERVNLSIRQHAAAVGRRVSTLCKGEAGLRDQLALYHVYYNFVLPHASLRQPLMVAEPIRSGGSAKLWLPCTPAMAAGLTDRVWSLREVLMFRVPPWPQPQMV
ncbi:hypothetical protein [Candidatus Entotheonella palauensis]|nr:hypothetical protein [Candidatus Entotheonella palauensis]